jgi:hypothetical protein
MRFTNALYLEQDLPYQEAAPLPQLMRPLIALAWCLRIVKDASADLVKICLSAELQ